MWTTCTCVLLVSCTGHPTLLTRSDPTEGDDVVAEESTEASGE